MSVSAPKPPDPRKERAAATRLRMVRAAHKLFSTRGLSTPLTAIAEEAGVAVQTLYFTFHTKSNLLMEAHDYAVVGEGAVNPQDQPAMRAMRASSDQRSVIEAIVAVSADIQPRIGPLLQHMQAAVEDPEIAGFVADRERLRVAGYSDAVDELVRRGPLRDGVSRQQALDIMLAMTVPALHTFLLEQRGWTMEQWRDWTVQSLGDQLLPPAVRSPGGESRPRPRRSPGR